MNNVAQQQLTDSDKEGNTNKTSVGNNTKAPTVKPELKDSHDTCALVSLAHCEMFGLSLLFRQYLLLLDLNRRYKLTFCSDKYLAERLGCTLRSVKNNNCSLKKMGLLKSESDGTRRFLKVSNDIQIEDEGTQSEYQQVPNLSTSGTRRQVPGTQSQYLEGTQSEYQQVPNLSTSLIIYKDIDLKFNKKEEEGLTPQVASLPSPSASAHVSDFSSAVVVPEEVKTLTSNPPFVSGPTALETLVDQLVAKKLAEASRSLVTTQGYSDTRTDVVQGQEGGKLEPTQALPVVVSKPKTSKSKKAKSYTQFSEQDFFWPDHWTGRGRQSLQTWVEYKRDTGKAVLLQSYQQVIKNFIGDEPGFVLAVDHSIANGYQGLFKPSGQQLREAQKQQQQTQVESTDWHDRLVELLAMED